MKLLSILPVAAITGFLLAAPALAQVKNGFDLSKATIPVAEIMSGGPGRDGIPAIDQPKFIPPDEAGFMKDADLVLSVTRDGKTRAYPLRVLVWHEIVNDTFGGDAIAVTYCPLCGTAMVFDRKIDGKVRRLGVSGLLYQSDVLMYDRENESLWSQLKMEAVSGPDAGTKLTWLPSEHLTWKAWLGKYPGGEVLSTDTGHVRDYGKSAYAEYFASDKVMFPVPVHVPGLPNKEPVIGVIVNGTAKAYPLSRLPAGPLTDKLGGQTLTISQDAASRSHSVTTADGKTQPSVLAFWFAWQGFYPDTELLAVREGSQVPDVGVGSDTGAEVKLRGALGGKPTVLVFYRGGWCPFCTRHLAALGKVRQQLLEAGFQIVAISPDKPETLRGKPEHQALDYTLLSDARMEAAGAFGITFTVDDGTLAKYKGFGIDLEAASGETHHRLPHPAVYIVDREGVIRFAHVNEDYKVRLEPEKIMEAARALQR